MRSTNSSGTAGGRFRRLSTSQGTSGPPAHALNDDCGTSRGRPPRPMATFEAAQLDALLQTVGAQTPADGSGDRRQLPAGGSIVVFLWIALDRPQYR